MKIKHVAIALLAAGLASAGPALAMEGHDGGFGHGGHGHDDGMALLHGVNLTDAQKTQVHQIMRSGFTDMKDTGKQMHDLHEQLTKALLSGATLDQANAIQQKEEALHAQMDTQRLAVAIKVRDVLTPAQLTAAATQHAKLVSLHEQEHAVMHGDD